MKETKGITLVALVITIIVLLILAGVAIGALTGDNSIIKNAQDTVGTYNNKVEKQDKKVEDLEKYLENHIKENSSQLEVPSEPEVPSNPEVPDEPTESENDKTALIGLRFHNSEQEYNLTIPDGVDFIIVEAFCYGTNVNFEIKNTSTNKVWLDGIAGSVENPLVTYIRVNPGETIPLHLAMNDLGGITFYGMSINETKIISDNTYETITITIPNNVNVLECRGRGSTWQSLFVYSEESDWLNIIANEFTQNASNSSIVEVTPGKTYNLTIKRKTNSWPLYELKINLGYRYGVAEDSYGMYVTDY